MHYWFNRSLFERALELALGTRKWDAILAERAHQTLLDGSIAVEEDRLGPWEPVKPPLDAPVK